jgi:hypothetical protein
MSSDDFARPAAADRLDQLGFGITALAFPQVQIGVDQSGDA